MFLHRFTQKARFRRKHSDITILSNNCLAGFLYRDLQIPYTSPTVGLQFTQKGFVRFCGNLESYLQLPLTEHPDPSVNEFRSIGGEKITFPVGKLGDLTLFLQHYTSFKDAAAAWERRAKRVNRNKLFVLLMAYDDTEDALIQEFQSLPLQNSLILTNRDRQDRFPSIPLLYGENPWHHEDPTTGKPYYWRTDYVKWFKKGMKA